MARRSDHSRDALYELSLDAARGIIVEDGFRALTTRNVANKIGYSVGTLYNLFSNLDDLIIHLNGKTLDRLFDHLAPIERVGCPKEDVLKLLDAYILFVNENPDLWQALFDHKLPVGQSLPDWYNVKIHKLLCLIEECLSPIFLNNNHAKQEAASVLWAGLHGMFTLATTEKLAIVSNTPAYGMAHSFILHYLAGLEALRGE